METKKRERYSQKCPCHGKTRSFRSWRYDEWLKKQEGRCALCKTDNPCGPYKTGNAKAFSIDYCNITGLFGGLLCLNCFKSISLFRKNKNLIPEALEYLKKGFKYQLIWNDVKDSRPKEMERVIVLMEGKDNPASKHISIAYAYFTKAKCDCIGCDKPDKMNWHIPSDEKVHYNSFEVTHWMPFPKSPTGDKVEIISSRSERYGI